MFWPALLIMVVAVCLFVLYGLTPGVARKYHLPSLAAALAFSALTLAIIWTGAGSRITFH